MTDELKVLIGADVSMLALGVNQLQIHFHGGQNRQMKYASLSIEAPFIYKTKTESFAIKPSDPKTYAPLIPLLHTKLSAITLTDDYVITLGFDDGSNFSIKPIEKYEAWQLSGDGLEYYVAVGV